MLFRSCVCVYVCVRTGGCGQEGPWRMDGEGGWGGLRRSTSSLGCEADPLCHVWPGVSDNQNELNLTKTWIPLKEVYYYFTL